MCAAVNAYKQYLRSIMSLISFNRNQNQCFIKLNKTKLSVETRLETILIDKGFNH